MKQGVNNQYVVLGDGVVLRAAIYARKSNDDNNKSDENKSITRQVDQGKAFAQEMGWSVSDDHVFSDDGISGAEYVNRPGLLRLQDGLADIDIVIVSEISRLGRNMTWNALVLDKFESNNVRLFSYMLKCEELLDSPEAKMMLMVKSFGAEMERAQTGQRTRDAAVRKFIQGRSTGGKCYGYDNVPVYAKSVDGTQQRSHTDIRINAEQAVIIRQIFRMYADGYGQKAIAKTLNGDPKYAELSMKYFKGKTPKATQSSDGTWAHTSIREMLLRERYIGKLHYGKRRRVNAGGSAKGRKEGDDIREIIIEDFRIIDESLWKRVQDRLDAARKKYSHLYSNAKGGRTDGGRNSRFLLSGLAQCSCCGHNIIATGSGTKGGKSRRYYYACGYRHNRGSTACDNVHRPRADLLEAAVLSQIRDKLLSDEAVEFTIDMALKKLEKMVKAKSTDQKDLNNELRKLKSELDNFVNMISQGFGSESIGKAVMERESKITMLQEEIKKTAGLSRNALPEKKKLRESARKDLGEFEVMLASTDVTMARKAIATLLTTPDGEFMPIRIGSTETQERGKLVFEGKLAAGRVFSRSGTGGRTRTGKGLLPGDFESPVSTNFTTPA